MSSYRWAALMPLLALTCHAEIAGCGKENQACGKEADPATLMQMEYKRASKHKQELSLKVAATPIQGALTLADFKKGATGCYDRESRDEWAVVDAHLHSRPFGGAPVRFDLLLDWMRRAGTLFAVLYGIGQRLPIDSPCTYYLDCPGTALKSSLKNDFFNAQAVLDNNVTIGSDPRGPHLTLSMSFLDLHAPEDALPKMKLLQGEFPGMFKWVGEINIVKQAIQKNKLGFAPTIESIKKWEPFMTELRKQGVPIALHCDLGNDNGTTTTEFLPWVDEALRLYPDNKIIWMHMAGLSKQLDPKMPPALLQVPLYIPDHIKIITDRLDKYPLMSVDLSWDVLYNELYNNPSEKKPYVEMVNKYPTRFISGSDFVAAGTKLEEDWRGEVNRTSDIYNALTDEAFRLVALGENYFKLAGIDDQFTAPQICGGAPKSSAHGWLLSSMLAVWLFLQA
mmetsp:Transcript_72051/g.127366  ORF Transcript_72051/g.127366 Transcript_72051/m.127366 type:complete len:451 (-) Transcript_72051:53-1405(-)